MLRREFCATGLNGACSQRLPSHNNNESRYIVANTGRGEAAKRCEQKAGVAMAPRRTAQHTIFILRIVPILAPLPHVASHIIQPILICHEAPDRTRPRIPIFITLDHGTAFRFVSYPRLLSTVIARSRRRRPLRTPWIKVYLGTLLFRRISGFRIQSHCYTPFNVGRQPVVQALGQRTRTAFSLGQPFAKRFHIVPLPRPDSLDLV